MISKNESKTNFLKERLVQYGAKKVEADGICPFFFHEVTITPELREAKKLYDQKK